VFWPWGTARAQLLGDSDSLFSDAHLRALAMGRKKKGRGSSAGEVEFSNPLEAVQFDVTAPDSGDPVFEDDPGNSQGRRAAGSVEGDTTEPIGAMFDSEPSTLPTSAKANKKRRPSILATESFDSTGGASTSAKASKSGQSSKSAKSAKSATSTKSTTATDKTNEMSATGIGKGNGAASFETDPPQPPAAFDTDTAQKPADSVAERNEKEQASKALNADKPGDTSAKSVEPVSPRSPGSPDIRFSISASRYKLKPDGNQNPYGLRKVKDEYLSTNRDGVSMWSYMYTQDNETFMAGTSFGMDTNHPFRLLLFAVTASSIFEGFILFCIVAQTVIAGLSLPGDLQDNQWIIDSEDFVEGSLLGVFTMEVLLRAVALGIDIKRKHTFFRNKWNLLDLFLVLSAWIRIIAELVGKHDILNPALFRIIRCLRPLRTAGFLQGIKSALGYAPFLLNIGLLLIIFIAMFAVFGMQLYGGCFSFECAQTYFNDTIIRSNYDEWVLNECDENFAGPCPCPDMVDCPRVFRGQDYVESSVCVYHPDNAPWGFDYIGQAVMTGWIVTTGDFWYIEMVTDLYKSNSLYTEVSWPYFIFMVFALNLVISNLFAAVIVQSFFEDAEAEHNVADAETRVRKARVIFNRIDHDHSGSIEVEEIRTIAELLGLNDLVYQAWEVEEAMEQMDINNDGDVDFEEFTHFWDSNGSFVVKLKKAIARKEAKIRDVWERLDRNQDHSIDAEEIRKMGKMLGINFRDVEVHTALDELVGGSDRPITFEQFSNWWFSSSKVAKKLKQSVSSQHVVAVKMFSQISAANEDHDHISVADIEEGCGSQFVEPLTHEEAFQIVEEARGLVHKGAVTTEGHKGHRLTLDQFEHWWGSDAEFAYECRERRMADMADARHVIEHFEHKRKFISVGDTDPDIDFFVLEQMQQNMGFQPDINSVLNDINVHSSAHDADVGFEEEQTEGVSFVEFYHWLVSNRDLAVQLKTSFDVYKEADKRAASRPFPFISGVSPFLKKIVLHERWSNFIITVVLINTLSMGLLHHNAEPWIAEFLTASDVAFSAVYVVEVLCKILGVGAWAYFTSPGDRFDFAVTWAFVMSLYIDFGPTSAAALRSLRVLVKCLRVMRSAKVLSRNQAVMDLLDTVLEGSDMLSKLGMFAIFMLVCLTIVAGNTLGNCHIGDDGMPDPLILNGTVQLPHRNFYYFTSSFHINFLVSMGAQWQGTMLEYEECSKFAWVYFVLVFFVMRFFVANLFVALIVEGFCMNEEEKLVKQEQIAMNRMAEQSGLIRVMQVHGTELGTPNEALQGVMASLREDTKSRVIGTMKSLPKAKEILKNSSMGARAHKLTGPMAKAKKDLGRRINIDAQLEQMNRLKEEASRRAKDGVSSVRAQAERAAKAAADAKENMEMKMMAAVDDIGKQMKQDDEGVYEDDYMDDGLTAPAIELTYAEKKKQAALNMFSLDNPIRVWAISVVDHAHFESAILMIIVFSSVSVASEGPFNADNTENEKLMYSTINTTVLIIFWMEFLFKIVANGFYATPGAYLLSSWNRLDFVILAASTVEYFGSLFATSTDSGDALRVLRVLRIMRPLRMMKHNDSMKVLIDAVSNFVPVMVGVVGLMCIFFITYAIFGLGLFMGKFYFCNCGNHPRWGGTDDLERGGPWGLPGGQLSKIHCEWSNWTKLGRDECEQQGGSWENPPYNFDDFFQALKTLFLCAQMGGWEDVIETGMSVTEVWEAPERDASRVYVLYFWSFIIFNSLFLTNIFIGLLTNYFIEAEGSALLTEAQSAWVQCQIFCIKTKPRILVPPKEGTISRSLHDFVLSEFFQKLVDYVVIINIVAMFFDATPGYNDWLPGVLDWIQILCMWFFTVDVVFKCAVLGVRLYLDDDWSKLDVVIVACTWVSYATDAVPGITVIRGARILRLLMVAKNIKSIRPITRTLIISIPACVNVVALTLIVIFVYAVAAMNLYGLQAINGEKQGQYITDRNNFDTFWNSFRYLIQIACGMDWLPLAYELENWEQPVPWLFFAIFVLTAQWLFLNLFVVTLIHNFMKCFVISKMELQEDHALHFKSVWTEATSDPNGPFGGKPFTEAPDFAEADVRMMEELVPMLLPPTETRDSILLDEWTIYDLAAAMDPRVIAAKAVNPDWIKNLTPGQALESAKQLAKAGQLVKNAGTNVLLQALTTFDTVSSPLGLLVPHKHKHKDELAQPFEAGTIAHVDGWLVEIIECHFETEAVRIAALDNPKIIPESVTVKYLETDEMPMECVLSVEDENGFRLHVPPVESFTGFVSVASLPTLALLLCANERFHWFSCGLC
jgi:Ca2+-binding EF-hand superfamily protein